MWVFLTLHLPFQTCHNMTLAKVTKVLINLVHSGRSIFPLCLPPSPPPTPVPYRSCEEEKCSTPATYSRKVWTTSPSREVLLNCQQLHNHGEKEASKYYANIQQVAWSVMGPVNAMSWSKVRGKKVEAVSAYFN